MFAVVARTAPAAGAILLRGRAAGVTPTLLFIAALAVSPGVCGACASGCLRGGQAAAGIPGTGDAFAVAATPGFRSCCGTNAGGPSEGTASPDAWSAAVAALPPQMVSVSPAVRLATSVERPPERPVRVLCGVWRD